jgi:8-oxo-dGTP pyrophosphatase MutT (NUDIX family)
MSDEKPAERPPVPILPAATILLLRDDPVFEVLMVKRHHQIDFAGGALVFPGGKTHGGDDEPGWEARTLGWEAALPQKRPLRIAAIREAYEEAGILLARHADGAPFRGDDRAAAAREDIGRDRRPFLDLIKELDLYLDLEALTVFAHWITPPMTPRRFDTWFYVAKAPEEQLAVCDGSETVDAEWIAPHEAVRLGLAGERTVIFPTRMNLQLLGEASSAEDAVARSRAREIVTVLPELTERNGERVLVLPPNAGYGAVVEPVSRAM